MTNPQDIDKAFYEICTPEWYLSHGLGFGVKAAFIEGANWAAALRAVQEPADSVRMPQSEAEAELMAKTGMVWLETNAPHKVRAQEPVTHLPQSLIRAVDRWFVENAGTGGCSDKDVQDLASIFYDVVFDGGRESVDDALAVVESFGPGISGLNDTFARQIILSNEVRRLRAVYEQAVHGRSAFRSALVDCRAALRTAHDHLDMHRLRVSHATDAEQIEKALGIQDCEGCNGSGEQKHLTSHLGPNDYEVDGPCSRCGGHGWVMVGYGETAGADACPVCVGGERG